MIEIERMSKRERLRESKRERERERVVHGHKNLVVPARS